MLALALYQPEIPQNAGTLLRLGACLGAPVHIIEPCGFTFSDRSLQRAGMDYLERAALIRHNSFADFEAMRATRSARLILLTTDAATAPHHFTFTCDDILMVGRESAGVPVDVHACAEARLRIPMRPEARSLNVAVAAAMVLAEAFRQTDSFPKREEP